MNSRDPDAILAVDGEGRIVQANPRADAMFGFGRGELAGRSVDELVPERLRGAELDRFGRRRDGAEFPVEVSRNALSTDGEALVVIVVRDLTERRAVEGEAEARRLRAVQAVTDAALATTSMDALLEGMLVPVRQALGADSAEIRLDDRPAAARAGAPAAHTIATPLRLRGERLGTVTAGRTGGGRFTADDEALLERLAERIALAVGQGRAYEAARAAEGRLREIAADVAGVVWEAEDAERRRFTFVSDAAESLLGHPVADWTERDGLWVDLIDPADRASTLARAHEGVMAGREHELEYRVRTRDGHTLWVRDRVRVARSDGRLRLRGLMVDMTERRELEGQLLQAQKMQAVGQLAGGVAHDFNNMLTAIIGYGSLLGARLRDEQDRADLAEIERAAKRAQGLTEQLLSFSRRRGGGRELVDLNELVAGMEAMLRRLIDEDVELVLRLTGEAVLVEADSGRLEQVLLNLVINARDAMRAPGRLSVTVSREEAHAVLRVSDSGVGMPPEVRSRVFEPFFTTKESGSGTGLGLSTVYAIVDQSHGRIEIESAEGEGTEVTVRLPLAPVTASSDESGGTGPVVLVAEDEPALRQLVRRVLEADGRQVLEAGNGREALRVLEQRDGRIDLLITDVVMPGMGGQELVAEVSRRWPAIKVIWCSGYTDSRLAGRGFDEDTVDLLRKPFSIEELRERVAQVLDGS